MSTPIFTISPEMQSSWDDIMGQMSTFVSDTFADIDSAYDWVCEMLEIDSFVDNKEAWNDFWNKYQDAADDAGIDTNRILWH
tara:strand:- start:1587 stop:1832 length:246 start_codon:yes stop_codon:yes gene_type:complete